MAPVSKSSKGPSAVEILEESVHLLRTNSGALAYYYFGTGLFALLALYFGRLVVHYKPDDGAIFLLSLALVAAFFVMKACQRRFGLQLHAGLTASTLAPWSFKEWRAVGVQQFKLHALGLWLVPLSAAVAIPFGWVYAYFQTLSVQPNAPGESTSSQRMRAWSAAALWPKQNHLALLILGLLWLTLYLNLIFTFIVLPMIVSSWAGAEGLYALSGWNYFSRFFLITILILTNVVMDPLVKTYYLLRSFHAESRSTGADLRRCLLKENPVAKAVLFSAGLLFLQTFSPSEARAANATKDETLSAPPAVSVTLHPSAALRDEREIKEAVTRALRGSHFEWESPRAKAEPEKKRDGLILSSIKHLLGGIRTTVGWLRDRYHDIVDWLKRVHPQPSSPIQNDKKSSESSMDWSSGLHVFAYAILGAVVLLFLFVAYRLLTAKRVEATPPEPLSLPSLPPALPDLRKEEVNATQLPAEGWLELARNLLENGEWRLCQRALFLATLSRRAQEGFLSLAAHKTNSEYERELGRRASGRPHLLQDFHQRRRFFESCWYGDSTVDPSEVRSWLQSMEVRA